MGRIAIILNGRAGPCGRAAAGVAGTSASDVPCSHETRAYENWDERSIPRIDDFPVAPGGTSNQVQGHIHP